MARSGRPPREDDGLDHVGLIGEASGRFQRRRRSRYWPRNSLLPELRLGIPLQPTRDPDDPPGRPLDVEAQLAGELVHPFFFPERRSNRSVDNPPSCNSRATKRFRELKRPLPLPCTKTPNRSAPVTARCTFERHRNRASSGPRVHGLRDLVSSVSPHIVPAPDQGQH